MNESKKKYWNRVQNLVVKYYRFSIGVFALFGLLLFVKEVRLENIFVKEARLEDIMAYMWGFFAILYTLFLTKSSSKFVEMEKNKKNIAYLTPTSDLCCNSKICLEDLKKSLKNEKILNIGLVGDYGSGKSSIINAYEEFYIGRDIAKKIGENLKNNFKKDLLAHIKSIIEDFFYIKDIINLVMSKLRKDKILKISLARYFDNEKQKSFEKEEKVDEKLEKAILEQLFYKVKQKKIPNSRLRKSVVIHKTCRGIFIFWVMVICNILLIFNVRKDFFWETYLNWLSDDLYTSNTILMIRDVCRKMVRPINLLNEIYYRYNWVSIVIPIIVIVDIYILYIFVIYILKKIKNFSLVLGKVSIETSFGENEDFNKNMDEIIYFFANTKYDKVFIEDLDRFDNIKIFEKLRTLNLLLNNCDDIDRKIVFIYAVKEKLFDDENTKVKFFDHIITVPPVLDSIRTNMKSAFGFEAGKVQSKDSHYGIRDYSTFIDIIGNVDDSRILNNIQNEYFMMYKMANNEDNKKFDYNYNKMLGLVVLKNVYYRELDEYMNEKNMGILSCLIEAKRYLTKSLEIELEKHIKEKGEAISEKYIRIYKNLKKGIVDVFSEEDIEFIDVNNNINIENFKNAFLREGILVFLKLNIFNTAINFKKGIDKKKYNDLQFNSKYILLKKLILRGYVDEDDLEYIKYYSIGSALIRRDGKYFIEYVQGNIKNKEATRLEFKYRIYDPEEVVNGLYRRFFNRKEILNFDLMDYLLTESTKMLGEKNNIDGKLDEVMNYLKCKKEECEKFIGEYIMRIIECINDNHNNKYIYENILNKFISLLLEKEYYDVIVLGPYNLYSKKKNELVFFDKVLKNVGVDSLYEIINKDSEEKFVQYFKEKIVEIMYSSEIKETVKKFIFYYTQEYNIDKANEKYCSKDREFDKYYEKLSQNKYKLVEENDEISFGVYPQTIVEDEDKKKEITKKGKIIEKFIDEGSEYYVYEVEENKENNKYLYSCKKHNYYKIEPLKWKILDGDAGGIKLVSSNVIEPFYKSKDSSEWVDFIEKRLDRIEKILYLFLNDNEKKAICNIRYKHNDKFGYIGCITQKGIKEIKKKDKKYFLLKCIGKNNKGKVDKPINYKAECTAYAFDRGALSGNYKNRFIIILDYLIKNVSWIVKIYLSMIRNIDFDYKKRYKYDKRFSGKGYINGVRPVITIKCP